MNRRRQNLRTAPGRKEMYMKLRSTVLTEEYLQELIEQLYGTLEYNRVLERGECHMG